MKSALFQVKREESQQQQVLLIDAGVCVEESHVHVPMCGRPPSLRTLGTCSAVMPFSRQAWRQEGTFEDPTGMSRGDSLLIFSSRTVF